MAKIFPTDVSSVLTKTELLRSLTEGLQQIAVGFGEDDRPIYVADVKQSKHGLDVQCTDGTKFMLELKM